MRSLSASPFSTLSRRCGVGTAPRTIVSSNVLSGEPAAIVQQLVHAATISSSPRKICMIEAILEMRAAESWLDAVEYARIDPAIIVRAGQESTMAAKSIWGKSMQRHVKYWSRAVPVLALVAGYAIAADAPYVDPASRKVEAKNMRLVGYSDLQARSAYQPVIQRHGHRYIAYIGHHGGTSEIPQPLNPMTKQKEKNGTS